MTRKIKTKEIEHQVFVYSSYHLKLVCILRWPEPIYMRDVF